MTKYTTMTDYPVRKTNHCYDLDRCLVEWELIQHRLGDKLWDSDKGLGTGIYSNYNLVNIQFAIITSIDVIYIYIYIYIYKYTALILIIIAFAD